MSNLIAAFYKENNLPEFLIKQKILAFERNKDIAEEFEYWIEHKSYLQNGISIEGYTAQSLADMSSYVNGEAAFILLIELRESPDKAMQRIKNGFKVK